MKDICLPFISDSILIAISLGCTKCDTVSVIWDWCIIELCLTSYVADNRGNWLNSIVLGNES